MAAGNAGVVDEDLAARIAPGYLGSLSKSVLHFPPVG
jgi:hypothetical protein